MPTIYQPTGGALLKPAYLAARPNNLRGPTSSLSLGLGSEVVMMAPGLFAPAQKHSSHFSGFSSQGVWVAETGS